MRFDYRFLRYCKSHTGGGLFFILSLIVIILSFSFYFFGRAAMIGFLANNARTEVLKLQSVSKSYVPDKSDDFSSVADSPSRIPKSCISGDSRDCICYDQYATVIRDFPVDRCQDIVNGFARF